MRRHDYPTPCADCTPFPFGHSMLSPSHPIRHDHGVAVPIRGDLIDDMSAWEHAWIDLGGEG